MRSNIFATISSGVADRRDPTSTGGKRRRCDDIGHPMITARLVRDDAVLAWLRATPDRAASRNSPVRSPRWVSTSVAKIQEDELTGQTLAARSGSFGSSTSLQLDQSDDRIAATVSSDSEYAHAHGYGAVGVGAKLRRITKAFGR